MCVQVCVLDGGGAEHYQVTKEGFPERDKIQTGLEGHRGVCQAEERAATMIQAKRTAGSVMELGNHCQMLSVGALWVPISSLTQGGLEGVG